MTSYDLALEGMQRHFLAVCWLRFTKPGPDSRGGGIRCSLLMVVVGGKVTLQKSRQDGKYWCSHFGQYSLPEIIPEDSGRYLENRYFAGPEVLP